MLICDTHADTLHGLQDVTRDPAKPFDVTAAYLTGGHEGDVRVQALALWTGLEGLRGKDVGIIDREMQALQKLESEGFHQVSKLEDAKPGVPNFLLTIEGGEVFESGMQTVDAFALWGVRIASIVWNHDNPFGFPAVGGSTRGLPGLGKKLVKRLNEQHIAVDVSHLNAAGVRDVLKISKVPLIATHSCCDALCPHPRNLTDEQLKAIFDMGGYVGVNFYAAFLSPNSVADLDTVVDHVQRMTELGGAKHIGMGSDFDGIDAYPVGLENAGKVYGLLDRMRARGFTEEAVTDFAGENFRRYLAKV